MGQIKERLKESPEIMSLLLFVLCGAITVYLTNNFFGVFAPFIIAYVITRLLHPLMVKIKEKTKLPNLINTLLCLFIFATVSGLILWLFGYYIVEAVKYIVALLSDANTLTSIISAAQSLGEKFTNITTMLRIEITLDDITNVVGSVVGAVIKTLSNFSLNIAMKLPEFLVSFLIGCIASFYMLFDYDRLAEMITRQLSPQINKSVDVFNTQVLSSLIKMILSYIVISAICFVELLIGFFILNIEDAAFIALLIAVLDVLPVLGSGGVLVPWGIVALLMGDPMQGIGMFVLWGVIVVVRQVVEPKIVGSQIGLHPLITIAALFLGLKLMGGLGLIVAPLYIIVCKKLNEEGVIHLYKNAEPGYSANDEAKESSDIGPSENN
jgi:sporulation integral membrane protein YtvI